MSKLKNWVVKLQEGYPTILAETFFQKVGYQPSGRETFAEGNQNFMPEPGTETIVSAFGHGTQPDLVSFTLPDQWKEAEAYISLDLPVVGKYYKVTEPNVDLVLIGKVVESIGIPDSDEYNTRGKAHYINVKSGESKFVDKDPGWCFHSSNGSRTFEDASQEEIDWLDLCIERNKFLSLEDFRKEVAGTILPRVNGYEGIFDQDVTPGSHSKHVVRYGCAAIDVRMLKQLLKAQDNMFDGTRYVTAIQLDSGVFVTVPEMQEIIKVHKKSFNNGNKK